MPFRWVAESTRTGSGKGWQKLRIEPIPIRRIDKIAVAYDHPRDLDKQIV
jgi:hypothetical protein